MERPALTLRNAPLWLTLGLMLSCASPQEQAEAADEEVYALLDARREALFDRPPGFQVDRDEQALRAQLAGKADTEPLTINLVQSLQIAAENSRDWQDQRESLYRAALDLTLERWRFGWRPTLTGNATVSGTGTAGGDVNAGTDLGVSRLFGSGATVVGGIGVDLLRAISSGDGFDALSSLSLSVTQPLLRGAAREVVMEPLTQSERSLVYEVRNYERFRRTFAVDIVREYYSVLRALDSLSNEYANRERLQLLREQSEALAEAGIRTSIEVDQARQNELRSEVQILQLQASLEGQLDSFAITLGLPVETPLVLDRAELDALKQLDGADLELLEIEALMDLALASRLDYLTVRDRVIDAERRTRIAADALRVGLDLEASVNSTSGRDQPLEFRSPRTPWAFGLSFDLPVDRLPERNIYRSSLLDLDVATRREEALRDSILSQIRSNLRQARSTRSTYLIQVNAVKLADRRVRGSKLSLEAGRASTRDLLEAQNALLAAQNAATSALISFSLARLGLYRDLELLDLEDSGIQLDSASLEAASLMP
jgi:outer membrane protein TolC